MSLKHLKAIRLDELNRVVLEIKTEKPSGSKLLEIGAGTGWQAKALTQQGYTVEAIDVKESNYSEDRIWPVLDYDGKTIPFSDNSFDVIFSSNVLVVIPHLEEFQAEIKRVLKSDGIVIHVLPSGSWRFWTNITHYFFVITSVFKILRNKISKPNQDRELDSLVLNKVESLGKTELIKKAIFPPRLGETGNSLTEIYLFSRYEWNAFFKKTGWQIEKYSHNRLFYSGYSILDSMLPIPLRRILSYLLGSACHIYVLKKSK
ncbi:methyltransferase type 11 [Candidatus Thiomargarita nelsonii]|uniref:Methyltransferase type 11 n=1 Tax=Candidatus Thiomargarita nelsonii TaxID=1003181 RepID=A0A176RVL4_9GAMM|nr:methyltransferase type 11 [Candidatus Thiomargarita nelsonii]